MHLLLPRKARFSSNLRHCHVFVFHELRVLVLCGVSLQPWTTRSVTHGGYCAYLKSGCATPKEFSRFAITDSYQLVLNLRQVSEMLSKASAISPGQSHHVKFGGVSGVVGCRPSWGGLVRSSAGTASGLVHPSAVEGFSVVGRQFCSVSSNEEGESEEDRDRRERRLWYKGLRKSIYESLQKERITVELFPELSFALDGNYYPKLVPLIAQKINTILQKDEDDEEIAELLQLLGITLKPHLVGEVLKAQEDWERALRFFEWAKLQPGFEHTAHTYNVLLCNIASAKNEKAENMVLPLRHLQEMISKGMTPTILALNILIDRLCKAKKVGAALKVMRDLEGNGVAFDLVTYNSVINGLGKAGKFTEIFELLEEMEQKGVKPDLVTYNSIIHSLGNSNRWPEACKIFDELTHKGLTPDVVTYNSLIFGLYKGGQADEAFKVFGLMALRGCPPDVVTYNSLIDGLAKASRLDDALKIFDFMKQKNCNPDVITYNTLICELISRNKFAEISGLLAEMKDRGCTPDKVTRNLLVEIGLGHKLDHLWGVEAATEAPADNEDGPRNTSFG
ncbi:protein MpPPR_13 [Marchantia polymorpha subsp. ruderalis]|uniref:Pentacotripeptide-repeat region of PRORP domain-containing protein n=2 Tax=Marchantia polymorpha TaxID=3197 RepID=A0AAF6AP38_MARPO|nr:hypothetical protein MARPO_0014s0054 [Marchantia polymorpha]PTQ45512.1 hypothetical protein MARPO_0014s0054 [Marchantia polymorpha]BBM98208.1 hypothetical protein Mp_1g11730 [Marchantia polymorpha subsp. ruderalis]BBM98209.1 hypothetical protein Mp_1g11730 [Marchantia polymorpha subsp. ruderalis]|eukprot:PTQ45511.1 hypothetical protein MARPO_0014s0054 [Marchantia polymorpha]